MENLVTELTDAEGPSSSASRRLGLVLGPLLGVLAYLMLGGTQLSPEARRLAGIGICTVLWWLFEVASPAVVSLCFAAAASLFGIASPEKVFAPFGNPIIFFFLGSFFLARAIDKHGVAVVILEKTLALPGIRGRPERAAASMALVTGLLSAFINNTAAAALLLPFAVALSIHAFKGHGVARSRAVLGVAYAASVGGMITTFGTAPTLISLGLLRTTTSQTISFLEWFRYSLPVALPLLGFLAWRSLKAKPVGGDGPAFGFPITGARLSTAGRRSLALVALAMLTLVMASAIPALSFIGETNAVLLPSLLLFFLPSGDGKTRLLSWSEGTQVDWQSLLLFGGGLSLGSLLFSTGLAQALGDALAPLAVHPKLFFVVLVITMLIMTEIASNTASVTLLVPIAIAACEAAGLPTKIYVAGLALTTSLGFMLPVGTPPNALAYGTGLATVRQMLRQGFLLDFLGFVLLTLSFLFWHL